MKTDRSEPQQRAPIELQSFGRRQFLRGAGGVAITSAFGLPAILAACSNSASSSASAAATASAGATASAETSTVAPRLSGKSTFWWWGEQEAPGLEKWVGETVGLYQDAHPGVEISSVLQATESLMPGFKAAGDAKQGPDLQYMWGGISTMGFAWQGFVTPISDLIPADELAHIFPSSLSETADQGKVYALPWYIFPLHFAYNKKHFRTAGLDPESPPRSWNDFLVAVDKLKAAGITPWGYGLKGLSGIGNFASQFNLQGLDRPIDILKPVAGTAKYTDPAYSEWMHRIKEAIDRGAFNEDVNSLDLAQGQDLFVSGEAGMNIIGQSQISGLVKALGSDTVGVMLPPKFGSGALAGKLSTTAQQLLVTSWATNPDVAADFLKFMHTPERLKAMNVASGAIPPDDRFDASGLELAQDRQILAWANTDGATNYQNFWPPQMDRENLFLAVQGLFNGQLQPDQAATQVQETLDRWRDKNQDQVKQLSDWAASAG